MLIPSVYLKISLYGVPLLSMLPIVYSFLFEREESVEHVNFHSAHISLLSSWRCWSLYLGSLLFVCSQPRFLEHYKTSLSLALMLFPCLDSTFRY